MLRAEGGGPSCSRGRERLLMDEKGWALSGETSVHDVSFFFFRASVRIASARVLLPLLMIDSCLPVCGHRVPARAPAGPSCSVARVQPLLRLLVVVALDWRGISHWMGPRLWVHRNVVGPIAVIQIDRYLRWMAPHRKRCDMPQAFRCQCVLLFQPKSARRSTR